MRLIGENLGGERGGETVFSGIGFALEKGQALVVTGPNGSGKSTLLRVVAGLLPAAEGRAIVEGGGEDFPSVASACHYLGHQNAMKAALTISENLRFWRDFMGEAAAPRANAGSSDSGQAVVQPSRTHPSLPVDEALEAVGLGGIGHLPFGYLSTGQRRRAAIAKLLVSYRPIWLLDEPTAGLDTASEERFSTLMQAHCADGGIIVAATHLALGIQPAQELRMGPA